MRLANGDEGRIGRGGLWNVVEAGDGEVAGDGDPALGGGLEDAEGEDVGERDDRGRAVGAVEQAGPGDAAGLAQLLGPAGDRDGAPVDAGGLEAGAPAFEPRDGDVVRR